MTKRPTPAEQEAAADAAYERGWVDSLDARLDTSPPCDRYWYYQGWYACADYRWADPDGRGIAPDRTYRTERPKR